MRSDTPRYSKRSWRPETNFDRPQLKETAEEILEGIPESMWDVALFDGETPRQIADHVRLSGCLGCRGRLDEIRASQPCALCEHHRSSHGYGLSLYPCGVWIDNETRCDCPGYEGDTP